MLVTPNADYNGPVSFTYSIEDSEGAESNTASVTVMVAQVNDAPEVVDDTATTTEDNAVDILVLGNDSDVDMDARTKRRAGRRIDQRIDFGKRADSAEPRLDRDGRHEDHLHAGYGL